MKFQRQAKILDLIEQTEIETQEELSEHLRRLGYSTTQATVSRDIKDLRLIKILSATSGKYKYAAATSEVENSFTTRLRNIFKECVTEISYAQTMVVIKTFVGTLGGDDTVLVVMRDTESADRFCTEARAMLN